MSLKLENEAFSSPFSDIKPVKTGSRLFAELHLGILLLGWSKVGGGIAESLKFCGSACSVLVFCIPMFKIIYIYGGPNFGEAIFIPPS